MSGGLSSLSINGFKSFSNGVTKDSVGRFVLQLNPAELKVGYVVNDKKGPENNEEAKSAIGNPTNPQTLSKAKESISFDFIIDTTGAVKQNASVKTVAKAVAQLRKITVDKISGTHSTPYVSVQWGGIIFKGKVDSLKVDYTLFDKDGNPIRAKISISITEHYDTSADSVNNQSPDITRIPTIKQGDSLISLCDEFYDDPNMFIRIAEYNALPTFRRLTPGTILEFPPIEK
jgi:hypothetical protein